LEEEVENHETTTFSNDSKTYIIGLDDATFDVTFEYSTTLMTHLQGAKRGLSAGGSLSFQYGPAGTASGNIQYTGECYIASISTPTPVGDKIEVTVSFQVTGGVTQGTY
jgi:hypothetical protein